ncbi:MAG: hypothetical protein N3I35_12640 [Clostridia bacterium]|nr:hypothetical protein [Clostridia bacterium]
MGHEHDKVVAGLICERDLCKIREAVCIQVEKVFDSCREKDCIENARVLFRNTDCIRRIIHRAINVKARRAEVVDVYADIEPVPFKRGFYTVDIKYFIRVTLDFFVPRRNGGTRVITKNGLVLYDKKVILFGSEGSVKIFKAHYVEGGIDDPVRSRLQQDNLPISKVEVAEPIALNARIEEICEKFDDHCCCVDQMPRNVADLFDDDDDDVDDIEGILDDDFARRRVVVTLGLFSIIKLVRFVQLVIPAFDYCVPNKECVAATEENPCELFETIEFPVDEFFPPQIFDFPGALEAQQDMHEGMDNHHHHGH